LSTQTLTQQQVSSSPPEKVMRTYQVVLKCLNQDQRKEINQRIKNLEEAQRKLLTQQIVQTALKLYRAQPKEGFFTRKLTKEIGKSPNIAESAFHWLYIAIKGKVDKEAKVQGLFNFWKKNPQQLLEWIIFGRSPYAEHSMQKYWKLSRRYIINLLTSTRTQVDAYWKKKFKQEYKQNCLQFNANLPSVTYQEVIQAIEDALEVKTYEFTQLTQLSKSQVTFLRKLHLLEKEKQQVASFITSWINTPQKSRWKSLKEIAKKIANVVGKKNRKLFSAVRLIVVFALFDQFMQSVPQLLSSTQPEKVVPLPFKRKRKGRLPIKLLMKKDYVITREGNAKVLTEQVKTKGWTTLGFPQRGKKKLTAYVLFPPKVLEYIHNGAQIRVFQIGSGNNPRNKPRVDVVLEGTHVCFRSTTLLRHYMSTIPTGTVPTLGLDINRLGKFMVTFNTPVNLPPDLLLLVKRYNHLTDNTLRELNVGLNKKRKNRDSHGCCKLIGELNRMYRRRRNILQEILRRLPHFLAAVMIQKHCRTFKIEELNVDPTGTKGMLARAIYTMPDTTSIYAKATWLASLELGYDVQLKVVKAFNTSIIHHGCGGRLDRTSHQYDYAPCKKCGAPKVNTHENAAKNIASSPGRLLHSLSFPSTHVRGSPSLTEG